MWEVYEEFSSMKTLLLAICIKLCCCFYFGSEENYEKKKKRNMKKEKAKETVNRIE